MKLDRITVNPAVCQGQPTIRGLRITVAFLLKQFAAGMTPAEILKAYPELEPGDLTTFKNPNAQPTRLPGEAMEHRMGVGDPIGPAEGGAKEVAGPQARDQSPCLVRRQKLHGYAESALQRGSLLQPRPVLPG